MTKELLAKLGIKADKDLTDEEVISEVEKLVKGKEETISGHKAMIDRYSSEIADYKKKLEAKMSDEEKARAHLEELETENANYKRNANIAERKASYLGLGYSEELAGKIATAEIDGQPTAEFHKQHQEALVAKTLAGKIDKTPAPRTTETKITKEQFNKMGYEELVKLQHDNPTLYEQLSKD